MRYSVMQEKLTALFMVRTTRNEGSNISTLSFSPSSLLSQDVPLISLANILHNAKLWNDAVIVATMAVEIAPHFAVNHFTLGNVYVAMVRSLAGTEHTTSAAVSPPLTFAFRTPLTVSVSSSFLCIFCLIASSNKGIFYG